MDWTKIVIELVLLAVVVLVGAWKLLPWREWAERWVGNDITKARVYVDNGEQYDPVNGWRELANDDGMMYAYEHGGVVKRVTVPLERAVRFVRGRRVLLVRDGELVDSRLSLEDGTGPLPADVVSKLIRARLLAQSLESITGGMDLAWVKPVLVALGLLAAVGVGGVILAPEMMPWNGGA